MGALCLGFVLFHFELRWCRHAVQHGKAVRGHSHPRWQFEMYGGTAGVGRTEVCNRSTALPTADELCLVMSNVSQRVLIVCVCVCVCVCEARSEFRLCHGAM